MIDLLAILYILTAAGLALFGFLGFATLWLYWRHRHDTFPPPPVAAADLPPVTVQLPIYNERYVVKHLIRAAAALQYPGDRLQIQVVDDSTDDTTHRAAALVHHYRQKGLDISLIRRRDRRGYKAGALANALDSASGHFVAIFDADFQPRPDFLYRTVPHFHEDPQLGMIQARWGHLNHQSSPLTAAQAIALDKHFAMEQTVRHRANLFPKFNGSGGIWRRRCLEDAGGWQDDTVCEDLCLSTRAILKGWSFRFLNDVEAPAELPTSIFAYKNQQARWAKGSLQCLLKYGRAILTDLEHSLTARLYALLSMSAYVTHFLLIVLLLLQLPLLVAGHQFPAALLLFSLAGVGQPLLFILGQQVLHKDWDRRLRHLPTMLLLAIGIAPSNSRAMLQALFIRHHPFIRTPKTGGKQEAGYRLPFDWIILAELFLAFYAGLGLTLALSRHIWGSALLFTTCLLGFGYVAYLSLREQFSSCK